MKPNPGSNAFSLYLLVFLCLIIIANCADSKTIDNDKFQPFVGFWKEVILNNDLPNDYSIRTFYFDSDSIFNMVQLEFGNRCRVWTNAGELSIKGDILYWDEFSAELNGKDTLIVNYHDPKGNIIPFTLTKSMNEEENQIMRELISSTRAKYYYSTPVIEDDGFETIPLESTEIDTFLIYELIDNILLGKYKDIHNLLIVKDGKIVLDEYFASKGKFSGEIVNNIFRKRPHHLASITKPVTSILMGIAIDKGYVSGIETPVSQYFPEHLSLFIDGKENIQIKHLLTMSSGISWNQFRFPFQDSRNDAGNMYRCKDVVEYYFNKPMSSNPGQRLNYCNAAATVCGALITNASGVNIDEFSSKFLFEPLGITNYYWGKYPEGTYDTDGSLALRPRDLAKIGQLMLNKGEWNKSRILNSNWIELSTKKHFSRTTEIEYGFYWQQTNIQFNNKKSRTILGWGDGGQFLFIFPDLNIIVVSTAGNYGKGEDSVIFEMLSKYILPAIAG